ncbi:Flagella accessory C family protein [Ferroglobus placidus DSM 10642]|uniref:Flagella accessory C family protein n=1 Tax=Ferroglobus placidus (strain DSM 10642 / AEDII12DO) TaxID=589924 RepID=D3RYP5_FERPA|nr:flagella accessory protein C [Ferroglobus placidus]ADC65608.1 Flagella accessory C family protein [Ferroglobus placidus DSM 10642]
MLKLFRRKKKEEEEVVEEETEEEVGEVESVEEKKEEEEDLIMKINERLNEIENRLPRIDVSISNLKREIDGLKENIQKLEDSIKDMMALYEVVSAQINPFVGQSKVTAISVERLNEMERKINSIEDVIRDLRLDLRYLFRSFVNVREIVNEVIYEEVISLE